MSEPCPKCRAQGKDTRGNNLVTLADGKKKCFACGFDDKFYKGMYIDLIDRGLDKATCEKYGVQVIKYTGTFDGGKIKVVDERCVVFNIVENGRVVCQKIRSMQNKSLQKRIGNTSHHGLFGRHLLTNPTDKIPVVITEGEFDAMAIYKATGMPAVSIPMGVLSLKCLEADLKLLLGWRFIALCFDNDEPGEIATQKAIDMLPVGYVRLVKLPLKDANDMLRSGRTDALKSAVWNAELYVSSDIVDPSDIEEEILTKPEYGYSLPWTFLYDAFYGLRLHHLYSVIGYSKAGKTEFMKEIIFHLLDNTQIVIGLFSLEQAPADTMQRLVGAKVNKPLQLPSNNWWDVDKMKEENKKFYGRIKLYRNDRHDVLTVERVIARIREMYASFKSTVFIIDNLTPLLTHRMINGARATEKDYTVYIANKLKNITTELPISIFLIVHIEDNKVGVITHQGTRRDSVEQSREITEDVMDKLINKPGMTWETGRMPRLSDIPKIVGNISDYVVGLARNADSDNDVIKRTLKVKMLACRLGGEYRGKEARLLYEPETGRYRELDGVGIGGLM